MIGPATTGALADRIGFRRAEYLCLLLQCGVVAIPLLTTDMGPLLASGFAAGVFAPGAVPLALGRVHLLHPPGSDAARAAWSRATTGWAVGQMGAAYAFSFLFARAGTALPLFAIAAAIMVLALLLDVTTSAGRRAGRA